VTGELTRISRHPIKGHGREDLASVVLSAGCRHPDFGVYATVVEDGKVALGDEWALQ
jgi:uncharacterized protein